jgi:hypothetical protein
MAGDPDRRWCWCRGKTTVVLREVLPPRFPPLSLFLLPLPPLRRLMFLCQLLLLSLPLSGPLPLFLPGGQRFVGVERRRSSSWIGSVQVDFLHHGIHLDVEVGNGGVNV